MLVRNNSILLKDDELTTFIDFLNYLKTINVSKNNIIKISLESNSDFEYLEKFALIDKKSDFKDVIEKLKRFFPSRSSERKLRIFFNYNIDISKISVNAHSD
jgi:hypothetical protein